jgi:hypothetical protein
MASSSDDAGPPEAAGASGRRDFMRKAAVVGTGAFVVPTIITVDPADAQALTSPPPEPPGRPESPPVEVGRSRGTQSLPAPGTQPNLAAGEPGDRTHRAASNRREPRPPRRGRARGHRGGRGARALERRGIRRQVR